MTACAALPHPGEAEDRPDVFSRPHHDVIHRDIYIPSWSAFPKSRLIRSCCCFSTDTASSLRGLIATCFPLSSSSRYLPTTFPVFSVRFLCPALPANCRTSAMFWGFYWAVPLVSAIVWIAMLLAMLIWWLATGSPYFESMQKGQTIAYVEAAATALTPTWH